MQQHFILGQADPAQSYLGWMLEALVGSWSNLFVLVAGVLIFAGACRLIVKKGRPAALAAYLVLLPLPVMISVSGTLKGMIASFIVLSASPSVEVTQQDYAAGLAVSLLSLFMAIMISTPTYAVLAFGLLTRTNRAETAPV